MTIINDTINTIWVKVLSALESKVNKPSIYNSFFTCLRLKSLSSNTATVIAPNGFVKSLIRSNYPDAITEALEEVTETKFALELITEDEDKKLAENRESEKRKEPASSQFFQHNLLNPKYTFDNFVVGKSNEEAFQSAVFVTENPGELNPLFLYSKSGLGKTHLLHAIGNAVKAKMPAKKVLYITADDFISEYVRFTSRERADQSLKDFFKDIDWLLIDDIQFFANKQNTCQMFFNIFNIMVSNNKQIVITSDRAPKELEGLEDRLISRFSSGLTCSIKELEQDTLIEILRLKIKTNGTPLDLFEEEVLSFLARHNSHNVRELEGALNRILFFNVTSNNHGRITMDIAHAAFDGELPREKNKGQLTPEKIISTTAAYYNLAPSQITSKVRIYQITLARQIAIYLCRYLLDIPFAQIGKIFGKDHSTVMASVQKVENLLKDDSSIQKAVAQLKKQLKAG